MNREDCQSEKLALRGLVVRDMCQVPSNWRCELTLPDFLRENNVVAIEGVDTRALVRHVRDNGAQRAVLSTLDTDAESLLAKVRASESIVGVNLAETVSRSEKATFGIDDLPKTQAFALSAPAPAKYKVVAYDCGAKLSIFQNLVRVGCELTAVPGTLPLKTSSR